MYFYDDKNMLNLVQTNASSRSIISSVISELRDYVIERFPKDFFKSIYIDTAETVSEQHVKSKNNKSLNKIRFPNLAITPELALESGIGSMIKSPHLSSPNLFLRKNMRENYKKVMYDPDGKFALFNTSEYLGVNFNFRITTNKFIQNMDLAYYLKSQFQSMAYQYLNDKYLITEIPKTFISAIAAIKGWDIDDESDMRALRLFMIAAGVAEDSIYLKTDLSTGKIGFYYGEKSNILTQFSEVDAPTSIIRKDMSEGEYTVNFRIQANAWINNAFIMSVDKNKFKEVYNDIENLFENAEHSDGIYSYSAFNISPLDRKHVTYFSGSDGSRIIGQEIYHNIFTYNMSNPPTFIDLGKYLSDDFKKVHHYMVSHNLDLTDLFNIKISIRDNIIEDITSNLNYEDLEISVSGLNSFEFALTVYLNKPMYDAIMIAIKEEKYIYSETTMTILLNNRSAQIKVKLFKDNREMYSEDINKMFRIKTAYGIGYIETLPDKESWIKNEYFHNKDFDLSLPNNNINRYEHWRYDSVNGWEYLRPTTTPMSSANGQEDHNLFWVDKMKFYNCISGKIENLVKTDDYTFKIAVPIKDANGNTIIVPRIVPFQYIESEQ